MSHFDKRLGDALLANIPSEITTLLTTTRLQQDFPLEPFNRTIWPDDGPKDIGRHLQVHPK
jgi:hypothetical protein